MPNPLTERLRGSDTGHETLVRQVSSMAAAIAVGCTQGGGQ
jgi:hypothetical protein